MRSFIFMIPLLAVSCLAVAERPCKEGTCPDGYACSLDGTGCMSFCADSWDCLAGYACNDQAVCEPACDEADCDGFACVPNHFNECFEHCGHDYECAVDFVCCDWNTFNDGQCAEVGTCY